MKRVILRKGCEQPLRRRHPWIFSGAVLRVEGEPTDGDRVAVVGADGTTWGWGHFHSGSIQVKMLAFDANANLDEVIRDRIRRAWAFRQALGLGPESDTTGFRLVHGEGDRLPGLIVDVYGDTAVAQPHSIGMFREVGLVVDALRALDGLPLSAVYRKCVRTLPPRFAAQTTDDYVYGRKLSTLFKENGLVFEADWESGQKTGFFLDQRENRALLGRYSGGQRVLNAFCYTGGFSVYALSRGAVSVTSLDSSPKALEILESNVGRLGEAADRHKVAQADVMDFLRLTEDTWDVVVLDPPAFAKSRNKRHQAVQGYKALNALGMRRVRPGGLLFTFSCSQVVDRKLFQDTVLAAALEAGREAAILHVLSQSPDHPVDLALPESGYLKGLALRMGSNA